MSAGLLAYFKSLAVLARRNSVVALDRWLTSSHRARAAFTSLTLSFFSLQLLQASNVRGPVRTRRACFPGVLDMFPALHDERERPRYY